VEINTDASNGQNSLEPKPSELGLSYFVSNVIHIRNKYDCSLQTNEHKPETTFHLFLHRGFAIRVWYDAIVILPLEFGMMRFDG
jgi:hypothetical protein